MLSTLSKATRIPQQLLMQSQRTTGKFVYRNMAILDEGARMSSLSFAEALPLFHDIKRLRVCGDCRQGEPSSKNQRKLNSVITMLEERFLSNKQGIIKRSFLNKQYRMAYDIAENVSNTFYDGKVVSKISDGNNNLFCHYVRGFCYEDNFSTCCEKVAELALRAYRRGIEIVKW